MGKKELFLLDVMCFQNVTVFLPLHIIKSHHQVDWLYYYVANELLLSLSPSVYLSEDSLLSTHLPHYKLLYQQSWIGLEEKLSCA